MKPPICGICHQRFAPQEGGLVYFKRSESDDAWHEKRRKTPGFVGHPPEAVWFCPLHIQAARARSHELRVDAMKRLREEFPSGA